MKGKTIGTIILVISLVGIFMSGCAGLDKTDNQIVDTVLENSNIWNKPETFNMNFISYEGKPGIRVWNDVGSSGGHPAYYVKYEYWVIDYEDNRMSIVDTIEKGVVMPDGLRYGNSFPNNSSEDEKRRYVKRRYVSWKKN